LWVRLSGEIRPGCELSGYAGWGTFDTLVAAKAAIDMALEGYAKS
jgi:hypothetical protein